jgi:hypothetical protein
MPLAPTTRPHGPTTRELLQIRWDYPVYGGGPATASDGAAQVEIRHALAREEALRFIARDDPRPLLVLRECPNCNRTERALLTPGVDNEKTILLSRWFHCVRLAMDVGEHDHPLHALFPRDDAEHLFVCAADGSGRIALEAFTSRTDLWSAMTTTLTQAYAVDPTPAYKQLATLIDGFDLTDQKLIDLQEKRSRVMEGEHFDPAELRKLDDQIAELREQVARDLERVEKLSHGELASKTTKSPAPARAAGG